MSNTALTREQQLQYERDGFLVLRNHIDSAKLRRLDAAFEAHVPRNTYAPGKIYPEPAKYTICQQSPADPELAFIAEDDAVVGPAECLLGAQAHLTAYVGYVRTPKDVGAGAHNDYKRWRPVGSSMNWLFTIMPLTDFDEHTGPLLVAPGSHQLEKVDKAGGRLWERTTPRKPEPEAFIDPQLKRGDLLLMNMYCWHEAPPNKSTTRRMGLFNKYAAVNAPPATGYYLWDDAVYQAFSPRGRRLLPVHSSRALTTARLALIRSSPAGFEVGLAQDRELGQWALLGGDGWEEDVISGWDDGNRIASVDAHVCRQLGRSIPWMTYVGDYEEGDGLCRVYGYPAESDELDGARVPMKWFNIDALPPTCAHQFIPEVVRAWADTSIIRGRGLTQARSKVGQYAV